MSFVVLHQFYATSYDTAFLLLLLCLSCFPLMVAAPFQSCRRELSSESVGLVIICKCAAIQSQLLATYASQPSSPPPFPPSHHHHKPLAASAKQIRKRTRYAHTPRPHTHTVVNSNSPSLFFSLIHILRPQVRRPVQHCRHSRRRFRRLVRVLARDGVVVAAEAARAAGVGGGRGGQSGIPLEGRVVEEGHHPVEAVVGACCFV